MDLKRDIVKYIRDKAKNKYEKGTECYICGEKTELDFPGFVRISYTLNFFLKYYKILIFLDLYKHF